MHRIQVQLTPDQERRLRDLARLRGSSISMLIREGVDALLAPEREERRRAWERAEGFVGRYSSGRSDGTEQHDDAFADTVAARGAAPP